MVLLSYEVSPEPFKLVLNLKLVAKRTRTQIRTPMGRQAERRILMRKERRLRVFENRVFRRVFGRERDEVTGEWRKLHNEELSDLYCSPNIVWVIRFRRMRWAGHVVRMRQGREINRVLVGKPEGKKPLRRPRRR